MYRAAGLFLTRLSCDLFRAYLLRVRVQQLEGGGMVVGLGFHYQVCDINSMYVFTADLCSMVRRNIFAFKESQVCISVKIKRKNFLPPFFETSLRTLRSREEQSNKCIHPKFLFDCDTICTSDFLCMQERI